MSWQNSLLDASFRGVTFDCLATDDEVARSTATHSYPYKNGGSIEDFGNEPRVISIQAIFYGDNYEIALKKFTDALNVQGSDWLVHPVFGTVKAQVMRYKISHDAEDVDQTKVAIQFEEDTAPISLFSRDVPEQKSEVVKQAIAASRSAASDVLVKGVGKITSLQRLDALRTSMTSALSALRGQAYGIVTSGLDVVNYPLSFATDIASLVSGIVDLRGFNVGSMMTDWRYVAQLLSSPVTLTTSVSQPASDVQLVASHVALNQTTAKADAAQIVLASEAQTPTLSAPDIELIVNDTRTSIEAVITQYRANFTLEDSRPVVEALKATALALQEAARTVIQARPPLIIKVVDAPGNYRLLAHKWYGDHTRATELLRLNPTVRMPNFISVGDRLNAYAS